MSFHLKSLLILLGLLLALAPNAYSDLISGVRLYDKPCWDFSDTTAVDLDDPRADIVLYFTIMSEIVKSTSTFMVRARHDARIAILPDSIFEDLKYAPPDSSTLYVIELCIVYARTYVVKTLEGHYAKFRFFEPWPQALYIEYVYQPDGSRKLFDEIAVENHSWGGIKNMFRRK